MGLKRDCMNVMYIYINILLALLPRVINKRMKEKNLTVKSPHRLLFICKTVYLNFSVCIFIINIITTVSQSGR